MSSPCATRIGRWTAVQMDEALLRVPTVEAIVFDADGVLVDSLGSVTRAWRLWASDYRVDVDALLASVHGRPARESVAAFLPPALVKEATRRIDAYELEDADSVGPLPGAIELLTSLPVGRWAVATSGNRELATARLTAAGLPMPSVLVTADDVRLGKPDPEVC